MTPKLFVSIYRDMARDSTNQPVGAPMTPPITEQILDITHKSIASYPFPQHSTFICIKAEADCCIAFGIEPEADPKYHFVQEGERLFYGIREGQQIAVIDSTIKDTINGYDDGGRREEEDHTGSSIES